ncbi:gluconate 2-dehydrogenase subunit 3 family protein [Paenibacillus hexagrammi]|uniref:Gluconate 2-dehydrogenase subunit 3 family protein n=1 Tax=Paenibacillus hexagrammi TaxID=2908839 RepID=A0ABY3SIW3_9BACL|nr:gluconate 2-dehydrogenase subunit 3 family protein [Paenibacillus sp. YPD9-1]UJF33085.1 gluconate 2-dehydrogenase subunit 3 family protein [Paenibacillus sp. YPD9-1]
MKVNTHYPSYNVMNEIEHWDPHTQSIVQSRLIREHEYRFLTLTEAEILRAWCALLVDDDRGEIIQYVLCHIDESLSSHKGEGQRKPGTPVASILLREGLKAIDEASQLADSKSFFHLDESRKRQLMSEISSGQLAQSEQWQGIPQKELFQKLLSLTIEAYYSHPQVWSEIGYGGPAYPRGYIRTHLGQTDPWEAVKEQ